MVAARTVIYLKWFYFNKTRGAKNPIKKKLSHKNDPLYRYAWLQWSPNERQARKENTKTKTEETVALLWISQRLQMI